MNCKQGDLALMTKGVYARGMIVVCESYVGLRHHRRRDGSLTPLRPCWRVSPPIPAWSGKLSDLVADEDLRPIRDNDGEDEILRLAGKPNMKEDSTCPA